MSLAYLPRPDRDEGGFALLQLSRPDERRYRLVARLHRRNPLAAGERSGAETVGSSCGRTSGDPESLVVVEVECLRETASGSPSGGHRSRRTRPTS